MPRLAQYRIAAIDDLHRQLRYAPRETLRRQMRAAERLVEEIEPDQTYPEDYVVYRITAYRPDRRGEAPLAFVGEALIGDLVTFIQRVSDALDLPCDHDDRRAIPFDEVARRLKVSTKTLRRYRQRGLVCHFVVFPNGPHEGKRLACFDDSIERFVERHRDRVDRAASFSRVSIGTEREIIEAARGLHDHHGLSLNEAALRLSREYGRAHETIRGLLRRHDRRSDSPIFGEHGPLTRRDAALIHRAWRMNVTLIDLAARFGKSPASIRRVRDRRRADVLAALHWTHIDLPTFELPDAESVILAAPMVREGLDRLLPTTDALAMIEAAADADEPEESDEHGLAAGYNLLKRRARRAIESLPDWPATAGVDRIETDLRWATLLKRRLVSLGLPAAIRRIEQNLHRPLAMQPGDRIRAFLRLGIDVVSEVVEKLDPSRGGRLMRLTAYAMDRRLASPESSIETDAPARRAAARHEAGSIRLDDPFGGLTPWERWLSLRRDLMPHIDRLDTPARDAIGHRYGLGSTRPLSRDEIADCLGCSVTGVERLIRRSELELRAMARETSQGA
jgi:AraC-like DNA-binding protein